MKKIFTVLALALMATPTFAQETDKSEQEGYKFTISKELPITSIKNQSKAGTCWCYSGTAFLEAELLRMNKGEYDFSEMYIVSKDYLDRAMSAIRSHGGVFYWPGGSFYDVLFCMEKYGLMPEECMRPGVMYGDTLSDHGELSEVTGPMVSAAVKRGKLQTNKDNELLFLKALEAVNEVYLGKAPEKFNYNGKEYTPKSFFESTGLKANDYVQITSFTHQPYCSQFPLEIPDNWRHSLAYNVPLDELLEITDYALENGYPVGWDSDVSEKGFKMGSKQGFAVLPATDANVSNLQGSDLSHWTGMTAGEMEEEAAKHPTPQRWVTEQERQLSYDNHETQDDHLMLIYGKAQDQIGNDYYMVKNSWGDYNTYHGIFYTSKAYFRYKTINILVHKDALSKDMKKKLGIK